MYAYANYQCWCIEPRQQLTEDGLIKRISRDVLRTVHKHIFKTKSAYRGSGSAMVKKNCGDGSDEPSTCPQRHCRADAFQCANDKCTTSATIFDSTNDCGDDSDEQYCDLPCPELEFKSRSNGKCMSNAWKCDGEPNWKDCSDEDPAICRVSE